MNRSIIIICRSQRLRQIIIDLRDNDKSQYFAITKFNNNYCLIIRSPLFDQLNMSNYSLPAQGNDPPFSHKILVSITHEQNKI